MRCMVVDDDEFSRAVIEHFVEQHDGLELVASCENAVEAANVLEREPVDLVFLDIEMPNMSGLELASGIRGDTFVVLVTSKEDYAVEAFDIGTIDYLVKPVNYARFYKAVQRVQTAALPGEVSGDDRYVFVRVDGRLVKLDLSEVTWIEAKGDYVMIHTDKGGYLVHATMKSMLKTLSEKDFVRIHRSHIVRLDRIDDIGDSSLVIGSDVIPIGRSYRDDLLGRLRMI